jgi:hypothetical protein
MWLAIIVALVVIAVYLFVMKVNRLSGGTAYGAEYTAAFKNTGSIKESILAGFRIIHGRAPFNQLTDDQIGIIASYFSLQGVSGSHLVPLIVEADKFKSCKRLASMDEIMRYVRMLLEAAR